VTPRVRDSQIEAAPRGHDQASALRSLMEEFSLPPDSRFHEPKEPGKVIAVAAGKGGVGRTSYAIGLCLALAARGRKALLIDADTTAPATEMLFGVHPRTRLDAVISSDDPGGDIRCAVVRCDGNVSLVAGLRGADIGRNLGNDHLARLIRAIAEIASRFDAVVVDAGTGPTPAARAIVRAADATVITMSCDAVSQRLAANLADQFAEARRLFAAPCRIVSRGDAHEATRCLRAHMRSGAGLTDLPPLRADPKAAESLRSGQAGRSLHGRFGHDCISIADRLIAELRIRRSVRPPHWWQRPLGLLKLGRSHALGHSA